jgi:hypothetical protein
MYGMGMGGMGMGGMGMYGMNNMYGIGMGATREAPGRCPALRKADGSRRQREVPGSW